jgi:hypothetical protein
VKAGLGSPETWQQCAENAVVFAQHSIMSGIGAQRGDLLQRNVEFHLQVNDVLERDGYGSTLGNGQLVVTIECGGSGYLKIGPALGALEEELIRRWNSSPPPADSIGSSTQTLYGAEYQRT